MLKLLAVIALVLIEAINAATGFTNERIVGGTEVTIRKHPHQVSLRVRGCETCAYSHTCGGSLYAADIVISAAHCVYNREAINYLVVAGTNIRNGIDGYISRVSKIVIHENYNASITNNDVALLYLATPFPLDTGLVGSIDLADEIPPHGAKAVVTGWGRTTEGGDSSFKLLETEVPIVDNEHCNQAYGVDRITDAMLCAGLSTGGKDACQGDSGGPLVVDGKLTGIVSWGRGCARPDYPGVYASVPHLKKWILDSIAFESIVFKPDFL